MDAKILILEDNRLDVELIVSRLKQSGMPFEFTHVDSRKEYEDALSDYNPTLILSDFKLPDINGFEAIEINNEREKTIPLIIISGAIGEENAAEVIKAGAVDFISKDHPKRLPHSVNRILKEEEAKKQALRLERRLTYLFENSLDGMMFILGDGDIMAVNPAACKMLGYNESDIEELRREDILSEEDPEVQRAFSSLENEGKYRGKLGLVCKNGTLLPVEITINFEVGNTDLQGGYAIFRDISTQLAHEKALQKEKDLQKLLKEIGLIFSEGGDTESYLERCLNLIGDFLDWPLGHICLTNHISGEIMSSDIWYCSDTEQFKPFIMSPAMHSLKRDDAYIREAYDQRKPFYVEQLDETKTSETMVSEGNTVQSAIFFPITAWNEPIAIMEFYSHRKRDCNKEMLGHLEVIGGHVGQLLERSIAQVLMEEQESMFRLMAENSRDMISRLDPDGFFIYVSPISEELFGYKPEELMGTNIMEHIHPEDLGEETTSDQPEFSQKIMEVFENPYRFREKKGAYKWVETLGKKVLDTNTGITMELQTATRDITERKKIEQSVEDALEEKRILLMEIHHRVKNNLAVISGMMQLQAFQSENEEVIDELLNSQTRIKSMAIIHELLYESDSFSKLNFKDNIEKIVKHISRAIQTDTEIELEFDLMPIEVSMDKGIPCALILNELLINIYKYAFKGRDKGRIELILKEENDWVVLELIDNGVGLPQNFSVENSSTLGMKLVDVLSQQLEAEFEYDSGDFGTHFAIRFQNTERDLEKTMEQFKMAKVVKKNDLKKQ
ncbi:MAG: PAS domain S-box protein [Balneolaceae bacterium]|nr:PAS domain S-box protein [Balneolaceae bacterium]